jgi:hypothetical protein
MNKLAQNGKLGGTARANSLTPEQRTEIARKAAVAKWKIPQAIKDGTLNLAGWQNIPCWVLSDERRIISQRSFMQIIQMPTSVKIPIGERISQLLDPRNLHSSSATEFIATIENPIRFFTTDFVSAYGYEGGIIVDFCNAILYARRAKNLAGAALDYADQAERLLAAIGKTGIVALIDEATGYQEIRDRKALEILLDSYLRKEFSAWAKRFPDEFYMELFRLKGWEWRGMTLNRPSCVGTYTNELVYARLEVGILRELQVRNPWSSEKKRRAGYHHCLLTDDLGAPALAQHLHTLIHMMRGFEDKKYNRFVEFIDRSLPKKGHDIQTLLPLDDDSGMKILTAQSNG